MCTHFKAPESSPKSGSQTGPTHRARTVRPERVRPAFRANVWACIVGEDLVPCWRPRKRGQSLGLFLFERNDSNYYKKRAHFRAHKMGHWTVFRSQHPFSGQGTRSPILVFFWFHNFKENGNQMLSSILRPPELDFLGPQDGRTSWTTIWAHIFDHHVGPTRCGRTVRAHSFGPF